MIPEVSDSLALLTSIHKSIDAMLEDVSDQHWTSKPLPDMNNIASILEHVMLVERKFFSVLSGNPQTIDTQAPFKADTWDVHKIKSDWNAILKDAEDALSGLTAEQLSEPGLKLGVGEVNKRQLLTYTIAHTTHHRGQIPIVKKLLAR